MSTKLNAKVCVICGDNANGRNYGALTCESCKCFFRRAVISKRITSDVCSYVSKCVINQRSRKYCKKCRFDKCLEAGMKSELVLPRIKSQLESDGNGCHLKDSSNSCVSDTTSNSDSNQLGTTDTKPAQDLASIDNLDLLVDTDVLTDDNICEAIRQIEDIMRETETQVLSQPKDTTSVVPIVRPIATFDKPFNDIELNRLEELSQAFNEFLDNKHTVSKVRLEFTDVLNLHQIMCDLRLHDQLITSTTRFCRKMSLFTSMCEQDRLALFKNSCFKMVCLRYLPTYNPNDDSFTYSINNDISLECNMNMFKILEDHGHASRRVVSSWIHDNTIVRLLMALILFHYELPNLVHSHSVRLHQQMYFYLLQRYLMQKFGSKDKSTKKLTKLMTIVKELHYYYWQHSKANILKMSQYANEFTPLVREIYDF